MLLRTCAEISATQGANVVHNRSGFGLIAEHWNEVSHVIGSFSTRPARHRTVTVQQQLGNTPQKRGETPCVPHKRC
jgi:hypothetical protein